MYLTDFVFDGIKLSTLGYIVGAIATSNNQTASMGSKLELQTIVNRGNSTNQIINTQYNEPISVTFDIIKHSCNTTANNIVEDDEIPFIMQWLNRTEYCRFYPIYNDLSLEDIYFNGTFTEISTIQVGADVVGFTVTFTSNAPYGFGDYPDLEFDTDETYDYFKYYDQSDEYGFHYPDKFIITSHYNGQICIGSAQMSAHLPEDLKEVMIKNCVDGEVITLDCVHKIISTSSTEHKNISKDFNYVFPRIYKTSQSTYNDFYSLHPCHVKIIYKPIKKVGIIV